MLLLGLLTVGAIDWRRRPTRTERSPFLRGAQRPWHPSVSRICYRGRATTTKRGSLLFGVVCAGVGGTTGLGYPGRAWSTRTGPQLVELRLVCSDRGAIARAGPTQLGCV